MGSGNFMHVRGEDGGEIKRPFCHLSLSGRKYGWKRWLLAHARAAKQ